MRRASASSPSQTISMAYVPFHRQVSSPISSSPVCSHRTTSSPPSHVKSTPMHMLTISTPYPSIPTRKRTSLQTIYVSTSGISVSVIRALVSLLCHSDLDKNFIINRYRGYQTCEYGRTDRGDHRSRIPPPALQPFYVLELKKQYQARRHARLRTVRPACKMCVPDLNI